MVWRAARPYSSSASSARVERPCRSALAKVATFECDREACGSDRRLPPRPAQTRRQLMALIEQGLGVLESALPEGEVREQEDALRLDHLVAALGVALQLLHERTSEVELAPLAGAIREAHPHQRGAPVVSELGADVEALLIRRIGDVEGMHLVGCTCEVP